MFARVFATSELSRWELGSRVTACDGVNPQAFGTKYLLVKAPS